MNQFLRFLAANSWLLIPIIAFVINASVRIKQKAAEQKARRDAQLRTARQQADALRTGRPPEQAVVENPPVATEDQRRARIEALRQQRIQQLQAMREKRAGPQPGSPPTPRPASRPPVRAPAPRAQTAPAARSPRPPSQPPAQPRRPGPGSGRPGQRAAAAPAQKALKTRMPTLKGAGHQPASAPRGPTAPAVRRPRPAPAEARRIEQSRNAVGRQRPPAAHASLLQPVGAAVAPKAPSALRGVRDMLASRARVRQALVVREILDSPVSLRGPGAWPGSPGA